MRSDLFVLSNISIVFTYYLIRIKKSLNFGYTSWLSGSKHKIFGGQPCNPLHLFLPAFSVKATNFLGLNTARDQNPLGSAHSHPGIWDLFFNAESAQLIRSVVYSHFDLSSLISMARMQSAQRKKARKKEKVVTTTRDWTGDLQFSWPKC